MDTRTSRASELGAPDYPVEITRDEFGFFVRIPDLPGCESNGETLEEAYASIEEAKELWIAAAESSNRVVPPPRGDDDFSGKFVVRIGPSIHRELVRLAKTEGMSLNAFVSSVLARETGRLAESSGSARALSSVR